MGTTLTVDSIREILGLGPKPTTYQRGAGHTTEMLLRAFEDAGKGNVVYIICADMNACGFIKSMMMDYAKKINVDTKLIQFVPASNASHQLIGRHDLHLYVDHFVHENGMFVDYELQGLINIATHKVV